MIENLLLRYQLILEKIDHQFNSIQKQFQGITPCRPGCSQCCSALFAIRPIDAALLFQGLETLAADEAGAVIQSAEVVSRAINPPVLPEDLPFRIEQEGWVQFDMLVNSTRLPCPILDSRGWCRLHRYRPRICRLAGIIFYDRATGVQLDDYCPLAKKARDASEVTRFPYPLVELDIEVMEIEQEFRRIMETANIRVLSGHTYIAAGLMEFSQPKIL